MRTCEEHDNCIVVYETFNCPVCGIKADLDDSAETVEKLTNNISDLEEHIDELNGEL